jgi:two-component system C4-dicarboxylate transport response regulator DctD
VLGVADRSVDAHRESGAAPTPIASDTDGLPHRVEAYEAALIATALEHHAFNVALTAQQLGIPKKTLYDKLKKYQIAVKPLD